MANWKAGDVITLTNLDGSLGRETVIIRVVTICGLKEFALHEGRFGISYCVSHIPTGTLLSTHEKKRGAVSVAAEKASAAGGIDAVRRAISRTQGIIEAKRSASIGDAKMTATKPKPRLPSERSIQEACSSLLALDGWRRIKTDLGHLRGMGVQERGMADDFFVRYLGPIREEVYTGDWDGTRVATNILWVEWKRKTGKAMQHQLDWHQAERFLGALTIIAGIDFLPSIEGFFEWYAKSGLMRKKLSIGAKV